MEVEGELLLGTETKKTTTPTAAPKKNVSSKLSKENKRLSVEVKKLKEHLASDKNLKQMKQEASECFEECKKIINVLEGLV